MMGKKDDREGASGTEVQMLCRPPVCLSEGGSCCPVSDGAGRQRLGARAGGVSPGPD